MMNTKVKAIRMKISQKEKERDETYFVKTMKYYCQGRGCRHRGPPDYDPTAVCFYMKGSECSHAEIKARIDDLLLMCPGAKVKSVQFVPLPVHLDTVHTDNRWVISLNSVEARNKLAGKMCHIKGQKITLRRFDDIIQLEYRKCSRANNLLNLVNGGKQQDSDRDREILK